MQVEYPERPQGAVFIRRLNRFVARVRLGEREVLAHVPSSGRMRELLYPGAQVYLLRRRETHRKTPFDLVLVQKDEILVSVDARLPNILVYRSLKEGRLAPFADQIKVKREARCGESRVDFRLEEGERTCFLEVKSVTLVRQGQALFPDAPTGRGTRHLADLARARMEGNRAAVLFLIQREDARTFSPNSSTDPDFAAELRRVVMVGVEVYAYDCRVTLAGVSLRDEVPVVL